MTSTAAQQTPERRSSLRALRHRDFALYFTGNVLSNCGTWFQNVALSLLVYRLTRSSFWVGAVNFAQFAGVLLLAPWAGAAADRGDRRRLIVATQVVATLTSGALAAAVALGAGTLPVVLSLALVLGLTTAFATPAMQAILPALVPRDDLPAAVAMNSVTFNLARAVGPVAGAFVVARLGLAWAIGLNAFSYLFFAGAMLVAHPAAQTTRAGGRARLRDSMRMVLAERHLFILLLVVAAVSLSMDPVNTVAPAFATRVYGRPDTFVGILIGAFGVGAVTASVIPSGEGRRPARTIAIMLALFAAGMIGFALSPALEAGLVALAVAGFGYLSSQTRVTTLLQLEVSDAERGRVMALWSVAFLGTRPLASLVDGGLATVLGPRAATLLMAMPIVVASAAMLMGPGRTVGEALERSRVRR
ncbi:protein of unknown function DUF894 DitE (plasmid) [Gemmatirosa kalamazoonensis]|uniref:Major facilitator superfamily (MFS) profile domain-containing protein n=1 Tax=Gemmatirosa kalamazoonensis TaxID=861299 RepID=W0RT68_9BACT|nr:MFS transporter [Gemmatirosa kalamazoonensis]AHG93667.1 protein of unknown function DUF894 DitE [Gemmatirosa kalamazoonensis]